MTFSPHARLGLVSLIITALIDQAFKLWMLHGVMIETLGKIRVGPFLDLVMAWNRGVSFGLFPQDSAIGQWGLLAFKLAAVIGISLWLAKAETRLTALALGLVAGGAVGNAIDRGLYGAVADFFLLHIETATWSFQWYVFNLADVAIVAGVAALIYESVFGGDGSASKSS